MSSPSLENMSGAPPSLPSLSLRYQASIYSVHSSYAYRNSSLECLVPDKKRVRFENNERPKTARGVKPKRRMASSGNGTAAVNIERKMSYGIGGAGNIRRPSDVIYPVRTNPDGTRRSSVWSSITVSPGSSPDGKRATIMSLFRKSSVPNNEASQREAEVEEAVSQSNGVNRGGKKKVEVG